MSTLSELFGSMVFNDAVMREKLPKDVYKALKRCTEEGTSIDLSIAGKSCLYLHSAWKLRNFCCKLFYQLRTFWTRPD